MRASASCGVIKAFMVEKESAAGASWQKAESVSVLRDTVLGRLATFLQLSCGKIVQVRTGVFFKEGNGSRHKRARHNGSAHITD